MQISAHEINKFKTVIEIVEYMAVKYCLEKFRGHRKRTAKYLGRSTKWLSGYLVCNKHLLERYPPQTAVSVFKYCEYIPDGQDFGDLQRDIVNNFITH